MVSYKTSRISPVNLQSSKRGSAMNLISAIEAAQPVHNQYGSARKAIVDYGRRLEKAIKSLPVSSLSAAPTDAKTSIGNILVTDAATFLSFRAPADSVSPEYIAQRTNDLLK